MKKPKILVYDIETAPIIGFVWGLWDQNVGLNQIIGDWHVIAWSAKWLGEDKIMYADQRKAKDMENDKDILKKLWLLLDEADAVVTQNGQSFDQRKLYARFLLHGMQPPSRSKHFDTKCIASKHFAFTSNKLEYLTDKLCTKYKKLKHKKFEGFELWRECLSGNLAAWREMEKYNKHDVLSTEELYLKLRPWTEGGIQYLFSEGETECDCGCSDFIKRGFYYTKISCFQRYRCKRCGKWYRSTLNLYNKEKRKGMKVSI